MNSLIVCIVPSSLSYHSHFCLLYRSFHILCTLYHSFYLMFYVQISFTLCIIYCRPLSHIHTLSLYRSSSKYSLNGRFSGICLFIHCSSPSLCLPNKYHYNMSISNSTPTLHPSSSLYQNLVTCRCKPTP